MIYLIGFLLLLIGFGIGYTVRWYFGYKDWTDGYWFGHQDATEGRTPGYSLEGKRDIGQG